MDGAGARQQDQHAVRAGLTKLVGWVEQSETHRVADIRPFDGFRFAQPILPSDSHPAIWSSVFGLAPNTHRQSAGRANVVIE